MENSSGFLEKFSVEDIEKLKLLFSIVPKSESKEVITLRVFADEYLNLLKYNRAESYQRSVQISFKHLFEYFDAQKSISSLQLKDVECFLVYLQQKVKKGYYVYFRNLKAAFNKARNWNYVKENFFIRIKLQKKQKLAPVFIDKNQLEAISSKIRNKTINEIVVFAFYTGLRLNEILNLKWKNIDLSSGIITVGDEEFVTKGKNQRHVPICEEAREVIKRSQKSVGRNQKGSSANSTLNIIPINKMNEYVFCKENGIRFTGEYVSKSFKRACRAACVNKEIHFHTLRHSFASNLVQKGVPLYTIKELLGHASISTTEIYSHLNVETLREAVRVLDG